MKTTLFVISDLHLGGAPAYDGKPGFQMCSSSGRTLLADFIRYASKQRSTSRDVHLVINGDIVDFLAEETFIAFTTHEAAAAQKLSTILQRTDEVWKSLETFVGTGCRLTLLLGNHDIELSLPTPRQLLFDRLGSGRIEFIYDNQAYVEGPVLIEHGNRYDSWNVISHDQLREVRSAMSRKESLPSFESPAGSHLVTEIMNGIKSKFPFVDLLKPEDAALLPLLAVLDPPSIATINKLLPLWRRQAGIDFDRASGRPMDRANIGGTAAKDLEMIALAQRLAIGAPPQQEEADIGGPVNWIKDKVSALASVTELWTLSRANDADEQLDRLYEALRARAQRTWQTFDVGKEDEVYLKPAESLAEKGFKVIVMGHTHLAKRLPLKKGENAIYLNTGTWADLMQVPEGVLKGDKEVAKQQLRGFVEDLRGSRFDKWRSQVPSFARIEFDADRIESADVYSFENGGHIKSVPDGPISQLMVPRDTSAGQIGAIHVG